MSITGGHSKQYIYDLAKAKLGDAVDMWLVTPRPEWEGIHDGTPHGLLESPCDTCRNDVLDVVKEMPDV